MITSPYTDKNGDALHHGDIVEVKNGDSSVVTVCVLHEGTWSLIDSAGGYWTRQLYHQPHRLTVVGSVPIEYKPIRDDEEKTM